MGLETKVDLVGEFRSNLGKTMLTGQKSAESNESAHLAQSQSLW